MMLFSSDFVLICFNGNMSQIKKVRKGKGRMETARKGKRMRRDYNEVQSRLVLGYKPSIDATSIMLAS